MNWIRIENNLINLRGLQLVKGRSFTVPGSNIIMLYYMNQSEPREIDVIDYPKALNVIIQGLYNSEYGVEENIWQDVSKTLEHQVTRHETDQEEIKRKA